jgi:uncharacterized membrane protein
MILVSVMLGTTAQLCLKTGMSKVNMGYGFASFAAAIQAIPNPLVLTGFMLYGISSILWLVILNRAPLSLAYPMLSLSYVLVVTLSALILREKVTSLTVLGLLMICSGVSMIGFGLHAATGK